MTDTLHTFVRMIDGNPHVFSVLDVDEAEFPAHRYLWVAALPYEALDNGLPAKAVTGVHFQEDSLAKTLKASGGVHIGHVFGSGVCKVIFRGQTAPPDSVEIRVGLFKKGRIALTYRDDADFASHKADFAPTGVERAESRNLTLHLTLEENGDVATTPRDVDYTFYFQDADARLACQGVLEADGYRLSREGTWDGDGNFGLTVALNSGTEPKPMAERCAHLEELAKAHNAEFDGWASPVMKQ